MRIRRGAGETACPTAGAEGTDGVTPAADRKFHNGGPSRQFSLNFGGTNADKGRREYLCVFAGRDGVKEGVSTVSQLHDLKLRIEEKIKADGLDAAATKGKIGLRTGKLFAFITPGCPDDPVEIGKLKQAAKEILNLSL